VGYINHSRPDRFDSTSFERVVLIAGSYRSFWPADFDGDGQIELLVDQMLFRIIFSDGKIVPQSRRDSLPPYPDNVTVVGVADLTGDNRPEILAVRSPLVALQNLGADSAPRLELTRSAARRTLTVVGAPSSILHLQRSGDLRNWQTTTDLRIPISGEYTYLDPNDASRNFFRISP
jgi:hypothetical protein